MKFHNGQEMWEHYEKRHTYNPFENLHLTMNDRLQEKIDCRVFDRTDQYNYLIPQARSFLMRVRLEDLFHREADTLYEQIADQYETLRKDKPELPDDLYELWEGISYEQIETMIEDYIQLLNPFTLTWIDPDTPEVSLDTGKYLYTLKTPCDELDTTFLYEKDQHPINAHLIYEYLQEDLYEYVPEEIHKLLWEAP